MQLHKHVVNECVYTFPSISACLALSNLVGHRVFLNLDYSCTQPYSISHVRVQRQLHVMINRARQAIHTKAVGDFL